MPEDQEWSALGQPDRPAGVASEAGDGDAPPAVVIAGRAEEDDVRPEALNDQDLAPLDAERVVRQTVTEFADADAECHSMSLGAGTPAVNRIVYV